MQTDNAVDTSEIKNQTESDTLSQVTKIMKSIEENKSRSATSSISP